MRLSLSVFTADNRTIQTYGRNLLGKLDILGQAHWALLERALQVDILDVLAKIRLLVDDADQAILDLQVDLCALLDVFVKDTRCLDRESGATVMSNHSMSVNAQSWLLVFQGNNIRLRWVGGQVDRVNLEDLVVGLNTELKWVVARNWECLFQSVLVARGESAPS